MTYVLEAHLSTFYIVKVWVIYDQRNGSHGYSCTQFTGWMTHELLLFIAYLYTNRLARETHATTNDLVANISTCHMM